MSDYFDVKALDSGVIWFTWHSLTRESVDAWAAYIQSRDGKMKPPLRVIYYIDPGIYPTPYLNHRAVKLMDELHHIPEDTRTAYLTHNAIQRALFEILARQMPKKAGTVRVFFREESALEWLLS